MSEEMLVKHCSPTLAGMKTGSMFVCRYDRVNEMQNSVRQWNRTLTRLPMTMLLLLTRLSARHLCNQYNFR